MINIKLTADKQNCVVDVQAPEGKVVALNAQGIEDMITKLARCRFQMLPGVAQSKLQAMPDGSPYLDGLDPQIDVLLPEHDGNTLVLAIAFQGLGWRCLSLSKEDAVLLSADLLKGAENIT